MTADVISLGGAAFGTSFILSFGSRRAWVEDRMATTGNAFPDKDEATRRQLFSQIWDLAKKHAPKTQE